MPLPLLRKFAPLLASTALCFSAAQAAAPSGAQKPGTITASAPLAAALSLPDAGRALRITYLSTNGITGKGLVPVTAEIILPPAPHHRAVGRLSLGHTALSAWTIAARPLSIPITIATAPIFQHG